MMMTLRALTFLALLTFLPLLLPTEAFVVRPTTTTHKAIHNNNNARASATSTTRLQVHKAPKNSFDARELKRCLAYQHYNPYNMPLHDLDEKDDLYLVWFGNNAGVHSIEFHDSNVILAFESKKACRTFCAELKDQGCFGNNDPSPQRVSLEFLEAFVDKLGVYAQVVPDSVRIKPPTSSVETWGNKNPSLRHDQSQLDYVFLSDDYADFAEEGVLMSTNADAATTTSTSAAGSWE